MISRLNMLILMQNDLEKAIKFYESVGLKLIFQVPGHWAECSLIDGTKVGLCPTPQELEGMRRTGFVFEVDDLNAMHEKLKDSANFINEPVEKEHGVIASVADPAGNIIELYQPMPEKIQEMLRKQQEAEACKGCPDPSCSNPCPGAEDKKESASDDSAAEG